MKLLLFLFVSAISLGKQESPEKLVSEIELAWNKTTTYQAEFKQTIFSKRLGTNDIAEGQVYVARPGKIRWDSKSDRTLQILNEKKFFHIHIPRRKKANIVDIYEDITKKADMKALAFLAGKADLKKSYNIEIMKDSDKVIGLKLAPKTTPNPETFIAEFDKKSYVLAALTTENSDNRVRIEFSNIKTNSEIKDELFNYKPSSTDVVKVIK